ncbi:MAG: glutathione transferase, partial [Nevskia sp.]|nr:glutathione transferase [Nevskia sp.]
MKLYVDSSYLSPYAMSVFVALREKGIPFELALVDLKRSEQLSDAYAAVSKTLRVPSISDDGFNLSESSAICEYLDERYPGPALYPAEVRARAKAREVQAWLRSDLMPIREERSTEVVFLRRPVPPLSA